MVAGRTSYHYLFSVPRMELRDQNGTNPGRNPNAPDRRGGRAGAGQREGGDRRAGADQREEEWIDQGEGGKCAAPGRRGTITVYLIGITC